MKHDQSVHRIRLRGPWQFVWGDGVEPSAGTFQHPEEWRQLFGDQAGILELSRRFHAPSNLDADEEVWVIQSGVHGAGQVRLNNELIGEFTSAQTRWEFRLPRPLPKFNTLTISILFAAATPAVPETGLYDGVVLEIRRATPK